MEAAPCGHAAAARLKLQVERVTGCRSRSYSMLFFFFFFFTGLRNILWRIKAA